MRSLPVLLVILAACGDNGAATKKPDAGGGSNQPPIDAKVFEDAKQFLDAKVFEDAPPMVADGIADALGAADGTGLTLPITHVTVTYLKPQIGSLTNDPAGFTVQSVATGPAMFIAVDPATTTPPLVVGDVVDFTITAMSTVASEHRGVAITGLTRISQGANVGALAVDVSTATDLVSNVGLYDARVLNFTGTLADAPAGSGQGFQKFTLTTAGITGDTALQVRAPTTLVDSLDMAATCGIVATKVVMGRFNTTAELGIYTAGDFTMTGCPAPAVVSATALTAMTVKVTFSRNIDSTTVMTNGADFTVPGLTVMAASVTGRTVTLTTTGQTGGAAYTVTVANTVKDLQGSALATTLTANFAGYLVAAVVRVNEVNANITNGCDLIELRVVTGGSMASFKITERNGGTGELNYVFPAGFNVATNDFVVIHLNSGLAACNPNAATTETVTKTDQPAATFAGNYDTAWDFWNIDTGLTNTDNVITLFDATNAITDAVLLNDDPAATATAAATETAAAAVLAATQWSPSVAMVGTYLDAIFRMNSVDDLNAVGTTAAGTSTQRIDNNDTNTKADWTTGAGAVSTWGALNVGQVAF